MSRISNPTKPHTAACQCENAAHFPDNTFSRKDAHPYGCEVASHQIVDVRTPYGTYEVCPACVTGCLPMYAIGFEAEILLRAGVKV